MANRKNVGFQCFRGVAGMRTREKSRVGNKLQNSFLPNVHRFNLNQYAKYVYHLYF